MQLKIVKHRFLTAALVPLPVVLGGLVAMQMSGAPRSERRVEVA